MGIFNIFIAGPQVFVCTFVAWFINHSTMLKSAGTYYHWEYAFIVGAISLIASVIMTMMIKEK